MTMLAFVGAALAVALVAAIIDSRTGHIPNWLTLGALASAVVGHGAVSFPHGAGASASAVAIGLALGGAAICVAPAMVLYLGGATGGGDVKLLAALGALVLPARAIDLVIYAFVGFALWSAVVLARRGKLGQTARNIGRIVRNRFVATDARVPVTAEAMTELRMGPGILLGTVALAAYEWFVRRGG